MNAKYTVGAIVAVLIAAGVAIAAVPTYDVNADNGEIIEIGDLYVVNGQATTYLLINESALASPNWDVPTGIEVKWIETGKYLLKASADAAGEKTVTASITVGGIEQTIQYAMNIIASSGEVEIAAIPGANVGCNYNTTLTMTIGGTAIKAEDYYISVSGLPAGMGVTDAGDIKGMPMNPGDKGNKTVKVTLVNKSTKLVYTGTVTLAVFNVAATFSDITVECNDGAEDKTITYTYNNGAFTTAGDITVKQGTTVTIKTVNGVEKNTTVDTSVVGQSVVFFNSKVEQTNNDYTFQTVASLAVQVNTVPTIEGMNAGYIIFRGN